MSIFVSDHEFVIRMGVKGWFAGTTVARTSAAPSGLRGHFAVANSVLVSCPPTNTSSPAASGSSDSTRRPVDVLPVASLTQPTRYGPPKPARLPIELISAIAPAAAVPDSHAVGSVQNTANVQNTPIAAIVSSTIVVKGSAMVLEAASA